MATTVPATQARAQFTQDCIAVFTDKLQPTSFLRSFFPTSQSFVRYLSIQVQRNYENVAVDVIRGTEGNRNKFDKSTEKIIDPPYYREFFDMTEIDLYDRLFGSTTIDSGVYSQLTNIVADRLNSCRNKIERAQEIQCAQVLESGIVTLTNAMSVDYGRVAGSKVANEAGNTWATGTVDPFQTLADGCTFLRQTGKAAGHTFNAILGSTAIKDLYNNTIFKGRVTNALSNVIDTINTPQKNSLGGVYHGTLTCGPYRVNLWTYPEYYDLSGTSTAYVNPKIVVVLPENPTFKFGYAAVPQLLKAGNGAVQDMNLGAPVAAPFVVGDYIDERNTAHIMDVKSAGIAIPVAVDQIYTVQVVA